MDKQIQRSALVAGSSLLLMTIISILVFPSLQPSTLHISGIAVIILLDVIVAISLYVFYKPVNKTLSYWTAVFRIVYAAIFTIALFKMPNLDAFNYIWDRGLLVFGIHLLLLGLITVQANYVTKWLGYLLIIASFGYVADSLGTFWGYSFQFAMFTFVGELILMFWLLFKGARLELK